MTKDDALRRLADAFPHADGVSVDTADCGLVAGAAIQIGGIRHAVRLRSWDDIDQGISTLRRWARGKISTSG